MTAPLFLSSGNLLADRRFQFATDLAARGDLDQSAAAPVAQNAARWIADRHQVEEADLAAPLAKTRKDNPLISERFELFIAGMEVGHRKEQAGTVERDGHDGWARARFGPQSSSP